MRPIDFAIIGGGCSGTYVAWRLANKYPNKSIRLYEASDRIGGRLATIEMPGTKALTGQSVRVELGGMRFSKAQLLVRHLIGHLGLHPKPFSYPISHYYLRGKHYYASDSEIPPYSVDGEEQGKDPGELVKSAIVGALKATDLIGSDHPSVRAKLEDIHYSTLTPFEWEALKRVGTIADTPLWNLGFWNVLWRQLSSEAYFLAHDGLGYQSILTNWNAAEAIPWFLRDFDCSYETVQEGMDSIPLTLAAELKRAQPHSIFTAHKATSIEQVGDKVLRIKFTTDEEPEVVDATSVILALPRNALQGIEFAGFSEELVHRFQQDVSTVSSHALLKLILGYKSAWWRSDAKKRFEHTRAVTDLPIRQIYYFDSETLMAQAASVSESPVGILMASYSDAHYVDFWQPLIRKPYQDDVHYVGGDLSFDETKWLGAFGAIKRLVDKAHRQVCALHPGADPPAPYVGMVMDWSLPPYLGGWHTWQTSVRPWRVMERMKNPFTKLYVCGEAYSPEQGWVEGALRSAELVLNYMGVSPPDWVPETAYLEQQFSGYEEYVGAKAP